MARHIHPTPFIIQPPDDLVARLPGLRRLSFDLSQAYASGQVVVSEEALKQMGSALWNALDLQAGFDAAHQAAGAAVLPIVIESQAAEVQALPWETLCHPQLGFLGKHPGFTLSRRISAGRAAPPPEKGPLRVLLFTSLPENVHPEKGRLKVEEEQAQVLEALLPWISQGLVKLEMPDDGRFATLQELLKSFQPHVLFLSGHGNFHHQPHSGEPPYGEFFFEDEAGDSQGIDEDQIAQALVGTGVQLVVLSACQTGKAASDALSHGLARRISAQGIPHVIGMRESILDMAGIQFARALCDELARRERVDAALQAARIAIQTPLAGVMRIEAGPAAAAELSLGQWPLPMLLSPEPGAPLVDWDFTPQPVDERLFRQTLSTVSLPPRFVGRRAELRRYKNALIKRTITQLLVTGPGGQGKTALAGKLALELRARGYAIFAWSARPENPWRDFELDLELALDESRAKTYDRIRARVADPQERASRLIGLLLEQFNQRAALFLDNLEALQDPQTLEVGDAPVAAWLRAAQSVPELVLLATSRWQIPGWKGEQFSLPRATYGDFLQLAQALAQQKRLPARFLEDRERLRRVYDALGGNCRGLEFFAASLVGMKDAREEEAFLAALAKAEDELQANMAIAAIYRHLPAGAQSLLRRLPAYHEPVPREGILLLGLDLPDPEALLERLQAVSLVEAQVEPHWDAVQYQCAPLVADWLAKEKLADADPKWLEVAADYHLYLLANERETLSQAMTTHHALRRAGRGAEADRLTLDRIVGPLTLAGFYHSLLDEWLPPVCQSQDPATRGEALGQFGKLLIHTGEFQTALAYLKQSLAIFQQIGDKAGEGRALNNISQIYHAQGDYETALAYLKQALAISQQIGDKAGEGATLNNISAFYHAQGDYETALAYLKQSLAIRQQIGDKAGEGATLNNISQIYDAQGDYETALAYLKQALAISQQIGDKAGEGAALNNISQIFKAQGDYETALAYLKQALAIRQQIGDKAGEGTTLNNISQIYDAQGDYETALAYLKQSLAISQQIGDKAGLCATLFNMGHIHLQNNQVQEAVSAWVTAYRIAKPMNLAQSLQALADLAPRLGLPAGLEGWEMLAQRLQAGAGGEGHGSELEQVRQFVWRVVRAVRANSPEAQQLFEAVSKMAVDAEASPQRRELGKVLQRYMSGIRKPDLSGLPSEMAEVVRQCLEEE